MFFARTYCPEALFGMRSTDELQEMDMVRRPDGVYEAAAEHQGLSEMITAKKEANAQVVPLHEPKQIEPASGHEASQSPLPQEGPPAQSEPADDGPPEWHRDVWINKRSAGFSDYVNENIKTLNLASAEIQREVRSKFTGMYPNAPFPGDEPQKTAVTEQPGPQADPEPSPQGEPVSAAPTEETDEENAETVSMLLNAREMSPELYEAALKILTDTSHIRPGIALEQMTINELNRLKDQINRLYVKEREGESFGGDDDQEAIALRQLRASVSNLKRYDEKLFAMGLKNLLQKGAIKNKFIIQMTAEECREMIREVEELRGLEKEIAAGENQGV